MLLSAMRRVRGVVVCCSSLYLFVDSVGRYFVGLSEHAARASWLFVAGCALVMLLQAVFVVQAFAGVRWRVRA